MSQCITAKIVKVVKAKTTILRGARMHARARNLDFTFVKVDEKVMGNDFRYVGIPSEDIQEVASYFQNRCVWSPSTLSRELRRNSTQSGKYIWFKAYDKAKERRKRSTHNAALAPEFAAHKLITKYLGAVVYFADPYASWQKGAIENTNKLIRQYIPKQANFDEITDKKVASLQKKINSRPRKEIMFETPKAEFFKRIA